VTDDEGYSKRQAEMLAPLTEQTYGHLCGPANGRQRRTGILRIESKDMHVPNGLDPEESKDETHTMHVVVAIITAIALGWICFIALLISASAP
jgi:hypothetical protein